MMNDYEKQRIMNEECNIARRVDMVYLVKQFGYTPYRVGTTHRLKEHDSFVIFNNTNTYNHYSHKGEPGYSGSPIDFVMNYGNMTMHDAIQYLLNISNYNKDMCVDIVKREAVDKGKFILPESNSNYRRVFAYLSKTRGIANEVISFFMHEKRLYESANTHNCVFVTYDVEGVPKYAAMRGTITGGNFKGDVIGSDKSYGFPLYQGKTDTVWVFEAPIDLMSFMTLYPNNEDNLCALGCLGFDALDSFLIQHTDVKKVGFILDNDKNAPQIVTKGKLELEAKGYEILEHPLNMLLRDSNTKDVNEYLIKYRSEKNMVKNKSKQI